MTTPTSGATGPQLAHDKVDRYRSLGAFGKPAYQSHVQLRAMLKSRLGDRAANYFARPTVDPDLGELRWTAELPGVARRLHELSPEEQERAQANLGNIGFELVELIEKLRTQGGGQPGGAAAFASLLDQAMKVPPEGDFLYFVGEQPVIAFWGFENSSGNSVSPSAQAPRFNAAAAAAPVPFAVPAATAATVLANEPPSKPKRPWWWWLLWALLALLLIALLLLLPKACTPSGGIDLGRVMPGASEPAASAPEAGASAASAPQAGAAPEGGPAPGTPGGPPADPGLAPVPAIDPSAPAASMPASAPELSPPAGQEPPLVPPADGASMPLDLPKDMTKDIPPDDKSTLPDEDKNPAAPQDNRKGQTDPPVPPLAPADAKTMKMPDDPKAAKKLGFLEGDWKAGDGLVDKATRQPLDLGFKFGKDGQGEMTLRRPDGVTCSGSVRGTMDGKKLGIQGNQSVPCSDGSQYGAPKIECAKDRGGKTECFGVNADGSRYSMGMQRQ